MAYSKVAIVIPSVTGDIAISVITSAKEVVNLFNVDEATLNTRLSSSGTSSADGVYITGYIDAVPGDVIYVKPAMLSSSTMYNKVTCYGNSSDEKLGAMLLTDFANGTHSMFTIENGVGHFTVPEVSGTTRIKISLYFNTASTAITKDDLAGVVITKNEPIS